jgi:hypothetical protein
MLKFVLFVFGLAAGSAGAGAWLLSEPESGETQSPPLDPQSVQARVADLQVRFREALEEGRREGRQTEERLRHDLASYRIGSAP